MGDTRPPEEARVPEIEEIRLRIAKAAGTSAKGLDPAVTGEVISDAIFLLLALDTVLGQHNYHNCCTRMIQHEFAEAGGT
jgi:hypothetical protein